METEGMKRVVVFWMAVLLLSLVASLLVSCRDDVEVPFPPSIRGSYDGLYRFVQIRNGVDTITDTTQCIVFVFRTDEYSMDMCVDIPESLRVFCDVLGTYELGNGVTMTITDPNYTRGVCTEDWGPGGTFGLDQTTDTLKLLHDSTDATSGVRIINQLKLLPVQI
jgi:hypothetical protein